MDIAKSGSVKKTIKNICNNTVSLSMTMKPSSNILKCINLEPTIQNLSTFAISVTNSEINQFNHYVELAEKVYS